MMQQSSVENEGTSRAIPVISETTQKSKKIQALPASYTNVPPVVRHRPNPTVPHVNGPVMPDNLVPALGLSKENDWLHHIRELLKKT